MNRVFLIICAGLLVAIPMLALADGSAALLIGSWLVMAITVVAAIVAGVRG